MPRPPRLHIPLIWRPSPASGHYYCPVSTSEFRPSREGAWPFCSRSLHPVDIEHLARRFPETEWGGNVPVARRHDRLGTLFWATVPLDRPEAAQLLSVRWMAAHRGRQESYSSAERTRLSLLLVECLPLVRKAFEGEPGLFNDLVEYLDESERARPSMQLTHALLWPHKALLQERAPFLHERLMAMEVARDLSVSLEPSRPTRPVRL